MLNFQSFLRKKWSEYSASSGQKGTVVDELAVKPTGLVMADFYNMMVNQRKVNNIANWESMTDEELNFFGSKFFFPRIDGDYTFGSVRVWFDEKKNVTFTTNSRFVSETGYRYKATQPGMVSRSLFKPSTDRFALYYIDIPVIAESKGNQFNITSGKINQITDIDFTYKAVSNPKDMTNGSKYETNEEYYNRIIYSMNDRSMMNKRSMYARLPEFFPVIRGMYIAASGDKYMNRDLVSGMDVSVNTQGVDFLGKISGDNTIKHKAFFGIFPPQTGELSKEVWGPSSVQTEHKYPLTIDPSDTSASIERSGQTGDPALHGYQLDQEFTNDMYKGLYFNDFKSFSEIVTKDLFNIDDENVGFADVIAPSLDWKYGAQGRSNGDLGDMNDGANASSIIKFNNNTITLSTGAKNYINVGKDIGKRTGVKLTGVFTVPSDSEYDTGESEVPVSAIDKNIQFMVGGINSNTADGYTGVGFGIRLNRSYNAEEETNCIVYFAHGEKYGSAQVFASDDDLSGLGGHISISDTGALAENVWYIQEDEKYEFEFIIHDDLRLTLLLTKVNPTNNQTLNKFRWELPKTVLNVYSQELYKKTTEHYGTTMKIALDAIDYPGISWIIEDLKAFDLQQSRATALIAIDVKTVEDPATISLRAFGEGNINGVKSEGYLAYIWDTESSSIASKDGDLTSGAWVNLPGISNPDGSKDVFTNIPSQLIQGFERYRVKSRLGDKIFIMVIASGTSKANSSYSNDLQEDIQSFLRVDYVKMTSQSALYYHANNKSDIYVATIKNSEELESTSTVLTKISGSTFFEMNTEAGCKMPVEDIISVAIGTFTGEDNIVPDSDYSIVRSSIDLQGSSKEEIRIVLNNTDSDTITVNYKTYPEVESIQEFFESSDYEKIYGDILVKHKYPVKLSFTLFFTGNITDSQLISEIRTYVDENIDGIFSTRGLVSYLYNKGFVNNVQEPIEVSYSRINDLGDIETGTFKDTLTIRNIDYFRIEDLSVSRL